MKKLILMMVLLTSFTVAATASDYILDVNRQTQSESDDTPGFNREFSTDGENLYITYLVDSIAVSKSDVYPDSYSYAIAGFGTQTGEGLPATLTRLERFNLGDLSNVSVSISEAEYKTIHADLEPAVIPVYEDAPFIYNTISTTGFFPESEISSVSIKKYRSDDLLEYQIHPLQYNHDTKELRIYSKIVVKIEIDNTIATARLCNSDANISNDTYGFVNLSDVINYLDNNYESSKVRKISDDGISTQSSIDIVTPGISNYNELKSDYLIITTNNLRPGVNEFVRWKKMLGFNTTVISQPSWTSNRIDETIKDFYQEHPNLEYVLLLGDYKSVPGQMKYIKGDSTYTDIPYFYRANDAIPFAYSGRIPASNITETQNVLNKIIEYEKNPPLNSTLYDNGLNCAYFQDVYDPFSYEDRRFVKTSEDVITLLEKKASEKSINRVYLYGGTSTPLFWSKYFSNGEAIPSFLLKSNGFNWYGSSTDILNQWNSNPFYILFRGHSDIDGWGHFEFKKPNDEFITPNASMLHSLELPPVVFSITCQTGHFDSSEDCFASYILKKPNSGASAVIASTRNSLSGHNDILAYSLFDAVWSRSGLKPDFNIRGGLFGGPKTGPAGELCIGKMLEVAQQRVEEMIPGRDAKLTRNLFHIFGDPSMLFRTKAPVDGNQLITKYENSTLQVSGFNTKVSVYNEKNDEVKAYNNVAALTIEDPDNSIICISGPNIKPYIICGEATSEAPSKILSYECIYNRQVRVKYNVNRTKTEAILSYTPFDIRYPKAPLTYPTNSANESIIALDTNYSEHIIQLIVDGTVADTIRFKL